jgi:DNA transformation protein and related proteins
MEALAHPRAALSARHPLKGATAADWQSQIHAVLARAASGPLDAQSVGIYDHRMAKPVTDPFVLHACELLSSAGPCVAKRMFGGWGISVDGMNIALIAWDTLFLKTNADTEPQWLAAGGRPFIYEAKGKPMKLNYHTPPEEALESPALMVPWARLALEAAVAARKPVRRPRVKKSP